MIEGLRVLPHYQDERQTDPDLLDCATCQKTADLADREAMRCGYLPEPPAGTRKCLPLSERLPDLETCPGYTVKLPDVVDIAGVYRHWEKGELAAKLGNQKPTGALLHGLETLQAAGEHLRAYIFNAGAQK